MVFEEITTTLALHFVLIFARMGSAMMVMSAFGETYIPVRVRFLLAAIITLLLMPVLEPILPKPTLNVLPLFLMVLPEILVGLMIGGITRILQAVLHVAGMIIAFQSALASALLFDASQGSQGSVIGNFLTMIGIVMLFATGLHHQILLAAAESYVVFPAGEFPPMNDFAEMASKTLSDGFNIAFLLASPMIIIGLLLYLGAGLLGRLMPNMQVFFVMMPVQIYCSFVILAITLSTVLVWYTTHYQEVLDNFLVR